MKDLVLQSTGMSMLPIQPQQWKFVMFLVCPMPMGIFHLTNLCTLTWRQKLALLASLEVRAQACDLGSANQIHLRQSSVQRKQALGKVGHCENHSSENGRRYTCFESQQWQRSQKQYLLPRIKVINSITKAWVLMEQSGVGTG